MLSVLTGSGASLWSIYLFDGMYLASVESDGCRRSGSESRPIYLCERLQVDEAFSNCVKIYCLSGKYGRVSQSYLVSLTEYRASGIDFPS